MGLRYVMLRIYYEIERRIAFRHVLFSRKNLRHYRVSIAAWRDQKIQFLFDPHNLLITKTKAPENLRASVEKIKKDQYSFFSSEWLKMADWHTNPKNGYSYDPEQHWSKIPDLSRQAGDIKYVWEKSRFCFLYDLIRYDYHEGKDQAQFVFGKIEDWIDSNPVDLGPNWRCSQEIALRVLNWTFALYYYQFSAHLDQRIFSKIADSIFNQMRRVQDHMRFSRIALHNNHTLTESLALYSTGMLFPFFPQSSVWKRSGKQWFENEIETQIFEDGTYIQFSTNYQRVVVQLLSWALRLGEVNRDNLSEKVYQKVRKSLRFLVMCQDGITGWLPNAGHNDGALFFPLSASHYRDFRPQLHTLANILNIDLGYRDGAWKEDSEWFGIKPAGEPGRIVRENVTSYADGGYFIARDGGSITLLRCAKYRNRPFQADNLHLDIWVNGQNVMRDAGTYSYNTDPEWTDYFSGTASHNTVMPGSHSQMLKGPRFMWSHWVTKATGNICEENGLVTMYGEFEGYSSIKKGIIHKRKVSRRNNELHWLIEDWIENLPDRMELRQIWHPYDQFFENYRIKAQNSAGKEIYPEIGTGWYAETYGQKKQVARVTFLIEGDYIRTEIRETGSA